MILLEVDAQGVASSKLESDAPRSVDVDGVTRRNKALQGVEVETGKIHLFRRHRDVQTIKADQDPLVRLGIDLGRAAFRPQLGQRLAPERLDRAAM